MVVPILNMGNRIVVGCSDIIEWTVVPTGSASHMGPSMCKDEDHLLEDGRIIPI